MEEITSKGVFSTSPSLMDRLPLADFLFCEKALVTSRRINGSCCIQHE